MRIFRVPCDDGLLTIRITSKYRKLENEFASIVQACSCSIDRSSAGMLSRIKRNHAAWPNRDAVRVLYRIDRTTGK